MNKLFNWLTNEVREIRTLLREVPALLMTFFVLSLVLMNLLANKSIDLSVSWLALDMGIVVSWIAFLSMDLLVKRFGPKVANQMTIVATVVNLVVSGLLAVAAAIPGTWSQAFVNGTLANDVLDSTIAGTWYVLLGSTIAFIVSAFINNGINWAIGSMFKKESFLEYAMRSYVSTFVAQFFDNLIFSLLVSVRFFGWSLVQCFMCALTGAFVELLFETVFSPLGYKIVKRWRQNGNEGF